jgi:hypothetical protein
VTSLAGLAVAVLLYAGPGADSPLALAVRWVLVPALVGSGRARWQAGRERRGHRAGFSDPEVAALLHAVLQVIANHETAAGTGYLHR